MENNEKINKRNIGGKYFFGFKNIIFIIIKFFKILFIV